MGGGVARDIWSCSILLGSRDSWHHTQGVTKAEIQPLVVTQIETWALLLTDILGSGHPCCKTLEFSQLCGQKL